MPDVYNTHKKKQKGRQIIIKKSKIWIQNTSKRGGKVHKCQHKEGWNYYRKKKTSKGSVYGRDCLGGVGKEEHG